jgi:hypothetical protein
MQSNMVTGEQGLKTWVKKVVRTALKHGQDVITQSTSNCIGEMLLLNTASKFVLRKQVKETMVPMSVPAATRATVNHHKVPHFWFERGKNLALWTTRAQRKCRMQQLASSKAREVFKAL